MKKFKPSPETQAKIEIGMAVLAVIGSLATYIEKRSAYKNLKKEHHQ